MINYKIGYDMYILNPYIYGAGAAAFTNEKSLLFDGVDEYVSVPTLSDMNGASTYSVSCWVKFELTGTLESIWCQYQNSGNRFELFKTATEELRCIAGNGATTYGTTSTALSTGTWYHIVVTYNGGGATNADKMKIYINGTSDTLSFTGTLPSTLPTKTTGSSFIGGGLNATTPSYYWNGNIDEVGFFTQELSSGNVTSLYNSGVPTDLDNTSGVTAPTHWWRMGDGDTFSTITDVGTTGGNDGTMTNMESGDIVTDTP